ncbi:MAG: hypothetical protein CL840_15575 [Crocinitomicaceae bacterium]|nr:hypothetical protein [Crocinitomicaceae bacterium]
MIEFFTFGMILIRKDKGNIHNSSKGALDVKGKILGAALIAVLLTGCGSDDDALFNEPSFDAAQFRATVASRSNDESFFAQTNLFKSAPTVSYQYKLSEMTSFQTFDLGPEKNPLKTYKWRVVGATPIWQPHSDRRASTFLDKEKATYWRAYEVFTEVEGEPYVMELPLNASYSVPYYQQMISNIIIEHGEVIVSYPEQIKPNLTDSEVRRSTNELVGAIINKINDDRNTRIEKAKLASREL